MSRFAEVLLQLQEKFPPEAHKLRDLPGGGQWYYVPWQAIRERLNSICPGDWSQEWGDPTYLEDYCYVRCKLTICGCTQEAIGSAQVNLLSAKGKDMSRGNPIERAIADAFKNAAEAFGICAYLDDQTDDKKKWEFARYMQQSGDAKAVVSEWQRRGAVRQNPTQESRKPSPRPSAKTAPQSEPEPMGLSPISLAVRPAIDEFKEALQNAKSFADCRAAWGRLINRFDEWGDLPGVQEHMKQLYKSVSQRFQPTVRDLIGVEVERLKWTNQQARNHIQGTYGKNTRGDLTEEEALEFLQYLQSLELAHA